MFKKGSVFLLVCAALGLAPAIIYFLNFATELNITSSLLPNISYFNSDWSSLGSFLSGTSGAIFSFMGTIAVVWTLIKNHESSEIQINMLRTEQAFSQFNILLDTLITMLERKKYPSTSGYFNDFDQFKWTVYVLTSDEFHDFYTKNPERNNDESKYHLASIAVHYKNASKNINHSYFHYESSIYTVLLDKIMNSDDSTKEALLALLLAKLDEHYLFLLNCEQINLWNIKRIERIAHSNIPLTVPEELLKRLRRS